MAFIIVTHADPTSLRLERIEHDSTQAGHAAVAYLHGGHVVARGVITEDALPALEALLAKPITLALAAKEDDAGNIDGRVCLVLPISGDEGAADKAEPWKQSVPAPAWEQAAGETTAPEGNLALLPIGNVVRSAVHRNHRELAEDAREMLVNLLSGNARDAVSRAIEDLLDSL